MDINEIDKFFNQTSANFDYYITNENKSSSIMILTSLGILITYSVINFFLDNPKKILEDLKTKEIKEYKKKFYDELEELENKEYSDKELEKFKKKVLKTDTSYGNVYMFYNVDNETFNYYCNDKNISYIILDALARKYAITYDCKSICINFKKEWKKAKKLAYEEQEKKEAELEKNKSEQNKKDSKPQIFAKYKSYEKNNEENNNKKYKNKKYSNKNKKYNNDYDTDEYDSDDNLKKPTLFNRKKNPSIRRRRFRINVKQTNRFTYKGNLNDYKDLDFKNKITKNVPKGKTNMSFKDFKNKVN